MFPVEITTESNSDGNLSPVTEDVYYGSVARHRTWSSRRHPTGAKPSYNGTCSGFSLAPLPKHCQKPPVLVERTVVTSTSGLTCLRTPSMIHCTAPKWRLTEPHWAHVGHPMLRIGMTAAQRMLLPSLPCTELHQMPAKPFSLSI